jgi:mRNA interferase RelE/StbE
LTSSSERRWPLLQERYVALRPRTADVLRELAPGRKRKVRAALDALRSDPELGKPLRWELDGLRRVRVGELRIVYEIAGRTIDVVAIGPRRSIYVDLERELRSGAGRT